MRPVSLHIEGFAAFRERVELDFEGLDFFALVGPTGAGKSTIIDAICFALYGSVPRYDDDRIVGKAVSLGKTEARVSLTFDVARRRYRATRVVRMRNGKASTPEAILEEVDATDGGSTVLADRASHMRPAVETLLGLPFDHFTKSVVLPQNEFARFLHDEPSKRQDLLARLLDLDVYARVGQRARRLADALANETTLASRQLAELDFASADALGRAHTRLESLRGLARRIDDARPDDDASADALRSAAAEVASVTALQRCAAAVEVPDAVASLATRVAEARAALDASADASRTAELARKAADERLEVFPEAAALRLAVQAHDELATLHSKIVDANASADASADALERVADAVVQAERALVEARAHVDEIRAAHASHALRATLEVGEPCPVCEQTVEKKPRAKKVAALSSADVGLTKAEKLAKQAHTTETTVTREHERNVAARDTLLARQSELQPAVTEHPDVDALRSTLAELERATVAAADARKADTEARAVEATARSQLEGAQRALHDFRDRFHAQRDPLGPLGPPASGDDLARDWVELAEWAQAQQFQLATRHDELTALADELRRARAAAIAGLTAAAAALDVEVGGPDLAAVREAVVVAGTDARHEHDRISDALERADKLRTSMAGLKGEVDVAKLLAQQLRADHFEKWFVGEAVDRLVASASTTLHALTGGNYSLAYDDRGEFAVVDHRNADEHRSVRTLSGGETFQASLALALALADQLSEMAASGDAKLDAIFLDEGFGSLDAETLETVAGTIETLGAAGRMVGVVTHVPALAERVPVRFRVAPGPRGATVVRESL